jgi:hypothetical protein
VTGRDVHLTGAVWMRFRAELRTQWIGMVSLAVLVGIAGGPILTAVAGARRTDTSLQRVEKAQLAPDLLINPDGSDSSPTFAHEWQAVDSLPNIEAISTLDGIAAVPVDATGHLHLEETDNVDLAVENGFEQVARPHLLSGRHPNVSNPDEILINEVRAKREHLVVGSQIRLAILSLDDLSSSALPGQLPSPRFIDNFIVVGVGLTLDEAARAADDPNLKSTTLFTPAFVRKLGKSTPLYVGKWVRLTHGARDVPSFEAGVRAVMNTKTESFDLSINFQEGRLTSARAQRAVRPYVLALWLFAGLATVAAIGVVSQAVARSTRPLRVEQARLVAVGFTHRQILRTAALRAAFVGVLGAAMSVSFAGAASGFMPIGPLRRIEPVRGLQIDWLVFAVGAAGVVTFVVASAVVAMRRRRPVRANATRMPVADLLASSGAPVPLVTGIRFALDRGRDGFVPLRSTLLGIVVAIAALVATLVYGAGLTRFTSTPERYGWPWDCLVTANSELAPMVDTSMAEITSIKAHALGMYSQFDIAGNSVAAVGIDPTPGVPYLPILRGRAPVSDDQIVLGETTLRSAHLRIGSKVPVTVQHSARVFTVVGTAVFPRLAPYPGSEPTGLGVGAGTTAHSIRTLGAQLGGTFFVVMQRPGTHTDLAALGTLLNKNLTLDQRVDVVGAQRPNDVFSYHDLSSTPIALAAVLIALALGSSAHLLVTGVRTRRRDIAVLKTFGLARQDVRSIILVQATVLMGAALIVAVPTGWIAGRALWMTTAHWLGIGADSAFPALRLTLVVVAALITANAIALGPAIAAARTRPAVTLRRE